MFKNEIENNKQDLINSIIEVCKFKSVSEFYENSKYPFGEECNKALEYVLNLAQNMGFKNKNIDGYCGYVEIGEGEELIGIIGHLDVVPANIEDGWNSDPFIPIIKDNKIYARGTIDDKGPVMAALYAMKIINEKFNLNKRVRLILGLNEEKDWKCIEYYKQKEELPTISFSPDANFPCIYAEKMIISLSLETDLKISEGVEIIEFNDNNNAINVVPKYCSLIIKDEKENYINKINQNKDIKISKVEDKIYKIESLGIASHAAHPENGDNAITKILKSLPENKLTKYLDNLGFFEIYSPKYLGGQNTEDESGQLSSNIAKISYEKGKVKISLNLRVPVKTSYDTIKEYYEKISNEEFEFKINYIQKQDALYVNKESYIVKTLTKIFNEEVKKEYEPLAIGGGTYARAFENCISYGMTMPGEIDMCHQVDEYIEIDKLLLATNIYAKAIYELLNKKD